jgi:hypothetical protein
MTQRTAPAAPIELISVYATVRPRNPLNRGLAVTDKRGAAWQKTRKTECKWLIKVSLS